VNEYCTNMVHKWPLSVRDICGGEGGLRLSAKVWLLLRLVASNLKGFVSHDSHVFLIGAFKSIITSIV